VNLNIGSQSAKQICRCCVFSAVMLSSGLASYAQSPPAPPASSAISVQTDLVVLPVTVTDSRGNAVLGLTEQNFRVYEDGRLQKIALFQQGDTPITVGLIVDHSRSMGPQLPEVADAVSSFARSGNPRDEMFVVDFNDDVSVELLNGKPFTDDPKELAKAIFSVRARGRTALYDAVAEGLLHLQLGRYERKALIIISDGGDNASLQKFPQVLGLAQKSQVVIYSIGLISDDGEVNPDVLRHFAKATGGVAYFPSRTNTVASLSTQIARDLREQYTLGFAPEKANKPHGFRKIEVKVSAPHQGKLRARTRAGYSAADAKPSPAESAKGAQ
jgi:Ca-activated chloride channel family protein